MPNLCDNTIFEKCNKEIDPKGYAEAMKICVSFN